MNCVKQPVLGVMEQLNLRSELMAALSIQRYCNVKTFIRHQSDTQLDAEYLRSPSKLTSQ